MNSIDEVFAMLEDRVEADLKGLTTKLLLMDGDVDDIDLVLEQERQRMYAELADIRRQIEIAFGARSTRRNS